MALCNSKVPTHFQIQPSQPKHFLNIFKLTIFSFLLFPVASSISFNFSSFNPNNQHIHYQGDATIADGQIQVTKNQFNTSLSDSVGRAYYSHPIHLWDNETGNLTDFNTHFSFIITPTNPESHGDGLTFLLSAPNATLPPYGSIGGSLGLFDYAAALDDTNKQIVAVEFDTFQNPWDPSMDHIGIDVNTINSTTYLVLNTSLVSQTMNAWVNYDSTIKTLSIYLTYEENPVFQGVYNLSMVVDLRKFLPEWIHVGFSAATGASAETHSIISWTFNSTLLGVSQSSLTSGNSTLGGSESNSTLLGGSQSNSTSGNSTLGGSHSNSSLWGSPSNSTLLSKVTSHKTNLPLIVCLVSSIGVLSCGVCLFWFLNRKKIVLQRKNEVGLDDSTDDEDDFEKDRGPRRFKFHELSHATNNFFEGGKLGQGGFGGVYKGMLKGTPEEIAVKRISKGSKQGKKEYKSEVKIISRLRHRNLVPLIGWCHEQGEFLLVYEFMPNGSLDQHLFGGKSKLRWAMRYKIALDLASAILYLHEEWEQCVVHRDIKSSNVMLDSNYNARLGDFGLARLVDHESGLETTVVAGTMGYLAPECVSTGKASKKSDVFSFGIVALEIACGRKPVECDTDLGRVVLLEWVWSLYGKGQLFEAVDKDLTMEYDKLQAERLILVGLWCCYPDFQLRPSIRQAIHSLKFEALVPDLPPKMPVPVYFSPSMCAPKYRSLVVTTDSDKDRAQSSSSYNTHSNYSSSCSVESSEEIEHPPIISFSLEKMDD